MEGVKSYLAGHEMSILRRWWRLEPPIMSCLNKNDSHKAKELRLLRHAIIVSLSFSSCSNFSISHDLICSCEVSCLNTYSSKHFTTPNSTLGKQTEIKMCYQCGKKKTQQTEVTHELVKLSLSLKNLLTHEFVTNHHCGLRLGHASNMTQRT